MTEQFGVDEKELGVIISVISLSPEVDRAILCGSRTDGSHRDDSDIDITLKGGGDLTQRVVYRIQDRLREYDLTYDVHITLFRGISDAETRAHIRRHGVTIYVRGEDDYDF